MGKFPQNSGFNERSLSMTHFMMRCFSTATFFSTATLKFYCRFYCHFYSHFLVAVEPKNLSTASGSRDQKTVLQPLAVEVKTSSTASGSRIEKSFLLPLLLPHLSRLRCGRRNIFEFYKRNDKITNRPCSN